MKVFKMYVRLLACLLLSLILVFTATGCFERPKDPEIPEAPGGPVETTIQDAYSGDRPDYDGLFDYNSGYVPQQPGENPGSVYYTVTLDESSPIRFAEGKSSVEVKRGEALSPDSFDVSGVSEKRELIGFVGENKEGKTSILDLQDCKIWEDLELKPYFSPEEGFTALDIGSGKIGRFNLDNMPGSIAVNKTIRYSENEIVGGGAWLR